MLYLLLVLVVLLIPFSVKLSAYTKDDALVIQAAFMLLGLWNIKLFSSSVTVKKAIASFLSRKKSKVDKARIFTSVRGHADIERLKIASDIGTGNAASTAIISGKVFGLIAPIVASLGENGKLDVNPIFDEKKFSFCGECILKTNTANILLAVLEIFGGKNGKASY